LDCCSSVGTGRGNKHLESTKRRTIQAYSYAKLGVAEMRTDRHEVPLATRLHPDDGEAGIRVVERDALDAADQRLALRATLSIWDLADPSIS